MTGWAAFWQWVVIVALATYFGLAVVIAIGGFFDVRKMFRRLNEAHSQEEGPTPPIVPDSQTTEIIPPP